MGGTYGATIVKKTGNLGLLCLVKIASSGSLVTAGPLTMVRMQMILPLIQVAALGLLGSQPAAGPKVGTMSLEDLTRYSDQIFIGQVEKVFTIEQSKPADVEFSPIASGRPLTIATVRIDKSLKGFAEGSRVQFLATRTWTCDISTAVVGERGLFFLSGNMLSAKLAEGTLEALKKETSSSNLYKLSHSGRGRMILQEFNGAEYVATQDIKLPEGLSRRVYTLDGTELKRTAIGDLEKKVSEVMAAQVPYFSLEHHAWKNGDPSWSLELWGDGVGSLKIQREDGVHRDTISVPREVMHELSKRLRAQEPPSAKYSFDDGVRKVPRRHFLATGFDRLITANFGEIDSSRDLGPRLNKSLVNILELWSLIRAFVPGSDLPDLRKADRLWIEAHQ